MEGTWKEIKKKLIEKKEDRRKIEGNERNMNGKHREKENERKMKEKRKENRRKIEKISNISKEMKGN